MNQRETFLIVNRHIQFRRNSPIPSYMVLKSALIKNLLDKKMKYSERLVDESEISSSRDNDAILC